MSSDGPSRTDGNIDKVEGQAKHAWGDLTGNSGLSTRGQAQDVAGDAQKTGASLLDSVNSGVGAVTGAATNFFSGLTGGSNYTSNQPSQTDGNVDSLMGRTKETLGSWTGDASLQGSGQGQHAAGDVQHDAATLTDYMKDKFHAASNYTSNFGSTLTGGPSGNYTSNQPSSIDASIDKGLGNLKSTTGETFGSASLQGSGDAQYAQGQGQETLARVREHVATAADEMMGRTTNTGAPDPWRAE